MKYTLHFFFPFFFKLQDNNAFIGIIGYPPNFFIIF